MTKIIKNLNKFALPLLAANILQLIISQVSLSFIGQQSAISIPAINTIENFLYSITGILGAFAIAFNILGSKALGEKNEKKLHILIKSSFKLNIIIGIISMILIIISSNILIKYVYHFEGELLSVANSYLMIMSPYILMNLVIFTLTNLIKIEKKTQYIFIISIISAIMQVAFTFLLTSGIGNIPRLGIVGSAISSIISLFLTTIAYLYLARNLIFLSLKEPITNIKPLIKKGVPLLFQEVLEGVLFIIIFEAYVSRLGVVILTTYSLLLQGLNYGRMSVYAFNNSVTVFVSEEFGKKRLKTARYYSLFSCLMMGVLYVVFSIIYFIFRENFTLFLTNDTGILTSINKYVLITIIATLPICLYENFKYSLQSIEKEHLVLILTTVINIISITLIILSYHFQVLTFTLMMSIYGINYFILGFIFFILFMRFTKNK